MSGFYLLQTEKAYKSQQQNIYTLVFHDKAYQPNKIEVAKLLKSAGYHALSITTIKLPPKRKLRGGNRRTVLQKRSKKYLVRLAPGQSIKESDQQHTLNN